MTGKIFNIQKFSLHDGPGIRTTVFFKGCYLNCKWCANPESLRNEIEVFTDPSACKACGACVIACEYHARSISDGELLLDDENCRHCLACKNVCRNEAISLVGKEVTLEEIMTEIRKDLVFYEHGGGVTLSGGEIFLQYDFAVALCKQLQYENINIAIETSGYVQPNKFQGLVQYCDLVYIDCKHYDNEKHMEGTGVSFQTVAENIRWLMENNKNTIVRIPVVPGYNDSLRDAEEFARIFSELHVKQVQLLPFHSLGTKKYEFLGKDYLYKNHASLLEGDLIEYKKTLQRYGVVVTNGAR